jgi:hypothetical protein
MICVQASSYRGGRPTGLPQSSLDFPAALRHCAVLQTARPAAQGAACVSGEPVDPPVHGQAFGGKNTRVRTSMLSLGGASAGASGFSNEVWNDSVARSSLALSWTRIRITSSGCCSEK